MHSSQAVELRHSLGSSPLSVDLGCGDAKELGFIGLDRFPLSGVDIVCDLDHGIPLGTNTVDRIIASHSLEHVTNLHAVVGEIFRVCKDRALITIIAPYEASGLNRANPYHVHQFNEHTARFFSTEGNDLIDRADYVFPGAEHWGLQASDHSTSEVDIRCVGMEFSYLPPYETLSADEQRILRKSLSDVCDQIVLRLVVVKSPISDEELRSLSSSSIFPTNYALRARRQTRERQRQVPNLFGELTVLPSIVTRLGHSMTQTSEAIQELGRDVRDLHERVGNAERQLVNERKRHDELVSKLNDAYHRLGERLTAVNAAMAHRSVTLTEEIRKEQADCLNELQMRQAKLAQDIKVGQELAVKDIYARLGTRILSRIVNDHIARADHAWWPMRYARRYLTRGRDLREHIGGELSTLWHGPDVIPRPGMKILPSPFLRPHLERCYPVTANRTALSRIEMGIITLFSPNPTEPILSYELMRSDKSTVLRSGTVVASHEADHVLLSIEFEPFRCVNGSVFVLKLLATDAVARIGVQLLEWQRVGSITRRISQVELAYRLQ